ncbi:MAG: hypothetical protein OWR62_13810 [Sulfobacillus thermotolerans]|nr:hypothetical protein [Sulfobacillus thermotolerans]
MNSIFTGEPSTFTHLASRKIVQNDPIWLLTTSTVTLDILARIPSTQKHFIINRLGNTPYPIPLNPLAQFSAEEVEAWMQRTLPMSETVRRTLIQALATSETIPEAIFTLRTNRIKRGKRFSEETVWPELAAEISLRQCFGGALHWHVAQNEFHILEESSVLLDSTALGDEALRILSAMMLAKREREIWIEFQESLEPLSLTCRMVAGGTGVRVFVPRLTDFFWWAKEEGIRASELRQMEVTVMGTCSDLERRAAAEVGWTVRQLAVPGNARRGGAWDEVEKVEAEYGTPIVEISRRVAGWGG